MNFGRKFAWVIALQVALVLSLVIWKQTTIWTGTSVWLRSAPVDPRDLLRGEYVALEHDIATLGLEVHYAMDRQSIPDKVTLNRLKVGDTVYVALERDGLYWKESAATSRPPENAAVFLKGKVKEVRQRPQTQNHLPPVIKVEYGIESWFVPRGDGPRIEKAAREKGKMLAVKVHVDRLGRAVLRTARIARRDRQPPESDWWDTPVAPPVRPEPDEPRGQNQTETEPLARPERR